MTGFSQLVEHTCVRDIIGQPLVVYRGEHGTSTDLFHSRRPSITFCDAEAASLYALTPNDYREIAENPRVIPVYLDIRRPITADPRDPFIDFSLIIEAFGPETAARLALKFADDIEHTNNWEDEFSQTYASVAELVQTAPQRIPELYFSVYKALDDAEFVELATAAGYDGAIHRGSGATLDSTEYRIFSTSQAVSKYAPEAVAYFTQPQLSSPTL